MDNFSLPLAAKLSESMQMKSKDALGIYGEELAARYLSKNGLVILERNWRCDLGEIDVITREKKPPSNLRSQNSTHGGLR